jgi:SAM-dependent methyltransferase
MPLITPTTDTIRPMFCVPAANSVTPHLGGCIYSRLDEKQIGDKHTWSPVVWRALLDSIDRPFVGVLDVGCGFGYSTKWFASQLDCHPATVVGLEGWSIAVEGACYGNIVLHDFQEKPYLPGCKFDLCWCCEFVEHLDEKYLPNLLQTFSMCDCIAMTHAVPGQGGHHHVNEQPAPYWVDKITRLGYTYDEQESLKLRALIPPGDEGHFVRETLLIFRRT